MGYCGCENIESFGTNTQFVQITAAGVKENHPHEVRIVKEAPLYNIEVWSEVLAGGSVN